MCLVWQVKRGDPLIQSRRLEAPGSLPGWASSRPPGLRAGLRLFCFPYAGGSARIYGDWGGWLRPEIDVVPVDLPGRGDRAGERPIERFAALIDWLVPTVEPFLDRPFALFGHGAGGLVAYELCRRLGARGLPTPERLLVSAIRPPHDLGRSAAVPPRTELLHAVRNLRRNASPTRCDDGFSFPILRADWNLIASYRFEPAVPLDLPITVFGGVADELAKPRDLEAWRHYTLRRCSLHLLPGDHLFIHGHERLLATGVSRTLAMRAAADAGIWPAADNLRRTSPP